jgi:hypothetical protein
MDNMKGINRLHCNKRSELASSASWDRAPPVEGFTSGSRPSGLCKRFGNPFTQLETEDLKVRAVLNGGTNLWQ